MRRGALQVVLLALVGLVYEAGAGEYPCDSVVSYCTYPYQGASSASHEWRVFTPSRNSDRLFLSNFRGFDEVRWDTTYSEAYYRSGDSLYSVQWRMGARPKGICKLPRVEQVEDWWFNPDSACWQVAAVRLLNPGQPQRRWWCELWQSARDFASWQCIRADSVDEGIESDPLWPWFDEPFAHRERRLTVDGLQREAEVWPMEMVSFDTTSNEISADRESEWKYSPSRSIPGHGLVFRLMESTDLMVSGPVFHVDLNARRRTVLPLDGMYERSWHDRFTTERCGLLLLLDSGSDPLVVDAASGRVLFKGGWNSDQAVWVKMPRR